MGRKPPFSARIVDTAAKRHPRSTVIETLLSLDTAILLAINGNRSSFQDAFMPAISIVPLLFAIILATFALSAVGRYRRTKSARATLRYLAAGFIFLALCVGTNEITTNLVKHSIGRLRPFQALPGIHYMEHGAWRQTPPDFMPAQERGASFYSGHSSNIAAATVALAGICPPLSPVIYAVPVLVGYSRLYLGRHYPSDVLCGLFAGAFIAAMYRRFLWPRMRRWALEERTK